jgi:hypothetical protein
MPGLRPADSLMNSAGRSFLAIKKAQRIDIQIVGP